MQKNIEEINESMLEGRNSVTEALKAGRTIDKVFIASGDTDSTLRYIASLAKKAGAVVTYCDRRKLDTMSQTGQHQGVIAMAAARSYCSVKDILKNAEEKGEPPLVVICDEITDPHNLGAIIRTAVCAGAHGVIIPKRRNAGLTAVVSKASAGAVEYMPIARVSNLTSAIETLKENGVWVYGTAAEGASGLYETDLRGPVAIVIGSEGQGLGRLVSEACDFMVSIPMKGQINSLNASNAAAILLYETLRQRMQGTLKG
ncbi:MAG: 23S rRNA (guanosine(2251)-2'-O)-methyltransferase RlmB [Oscillospiraceae bacterium]|nr:23S rRNA (guanosine(2251)-2'-O)-methyltransferase RlmB [Oscillospiraceae bacterium]